MRIAIDVMGGDHAPDKILEGALQALPLLEPDDKLILVGNKELIAPHIAHTSQHDRIQIEHASQVITMDDSPIEAIRGKRDSSIVRMVKFGKEGHADAMISAGNTGALVAAGVLMLKPLAGVDRPGIACFLPSVKGGVLLCDAGANIQPKPAHLYQYAVMGSIYAKALGKSAPPPSPTVGILNIGSEDEKGTQLVKDAKALIQADPSINFVGYVEGRDIPRHPCDVLITDGFTGNVTLKVTEGFTTAVLQALQKEAMSDADFAVKLKPFLGRALKQYDHEEVGGALLLGVQGLFFKVHGSAGARAIKNAVVAAKAVGKLDVNAAIEKRLAKGA
ncbi:MAG: phosphate acyltransferase PlsX [Phycisphaerales bacterium]|nr:phosphate acyltransferase PlsX [Phycisphaerales bacterium]